MLRHAAGVPEDRAVHERGIVERELLLLGLLPPSFVVLHVVLSLIIYSVLIPSKVALLFPEPER